MQLSYGHNAERFTTGREAMRSIAALFAACGCGNDNLRWNRVTGYVSTHAHSDVNDRRYPVIGRVHSNEFSRKSGVICPLPMKKDGIWYVQALTTLHY